jgi:molecular chaperone GrpE
MKNKNKNLPGEEKAKEEVKEEKAPVLPEEELKKKKEECDGLLDKYMRLGAEFDNARKRWLKEREEIIRFANASLLGEFIVILDETEQALKMAREHADSGEIVKGIELIYNNFLNIFKKKDLKVIETEGKKFDPHFHEIVTSREVENDEDEHKILEEVQKGYMLENRVLRTSKVIVGIKKQKTEDREQEVE